MEANPMHQMNHLAKFGIVALAIGLTGCVATAPTLGDSGAKTVATGAAGGANSENANTQLEKCDRPFGTAALVEDQAANWYQVLTRQHNLGSTIPVIRLLVQQSNCFVIVDRGRAMANMEQERNLQKSGELRSNSNFGKGQMVSADYSITPEIIFSAQGTQGLGGALGGFSGAMGLAGAVVGSMKKNEASTILLLTDNRSGVQVSASEGSGSNMDFGFAGGLFGGSMGGGMGGYTSTPQGKVIVAAFMDAYNQMVKSLRNYRAQSMGGGKQLGAGGSLQVDGSSNTPSPQTNNKSTSVQEAQTRLNQLGYNVGKPDGKFGAKMKSALTKFQSSRGLPTTGQLDAATQTELSK